MAIRTDLAAEKEQQIRVSGKSSLEGIDKEEFLKDGFKISRINVKTSHASQILGKPMGSYVTLSAQSGFDALPHRISQAGEILCCELEKLAGDCKSALVVGLGNEAITPDSLGGLVSKKIFATRHLKTLAPQLVDEDTKEISVIATGVTGNTGLEASEIVRALCRKINPDAVFVIDALACSDVSNLGCTIQITDTGISPGSGVGNSRKELSENTLGCKVIAVGIPTVIDMETAIFQLSDAENQDKSYASMMVTPREIDKLVNVGAQIVHTALNRLFHPDLSQEDISSLVG